MVVIPYLKFLQNLLETSENWRRSNEPTKCIFHSNYVEVLLIFQICKLIYGKGKNKQICMNSWGILIVE